MVIPVMNFPPKTANREGHDPSNRFYGTGEIYLEDRAWRSLLWPKPLLYGL